MQGQLRIGIVDISIFKFKYGYGYSKRFGDAHEIWDESKVERLSNFIDSGTVKAAIPFVEEIARLASLHDIFIVVDDYDYSYYRNSICQGYKKRKSKPGRLASCTKRLYRIARKFLQDTGVLWLEKAGFEADDIIYTLVKAYSGSGHKVTVYSSDSDLHGLVCFGNTVIKSPNPKSKLQVVTRKSYINYYANLPQVHWFMKALEGDKADTYIGIRSISGNLMEWNRSVFANDFLFLGEVEADLDYVSGYYCWKKEYEVPVRLAYPIAVEGIQIPFIRNTPEQSLFAQTISAMYKHAEELRERAGYYLYKDDLRK